MFRCCDCHRALCRAHRTTELRPTGAIVPQLYEVPGSRCVECHKAESDKLQRAEEAAFARADAATAARARDQAARPSVEEVLESISSIETIEERLIVGIARATAAAGPESVGKVVQSLYPTYSMGWVYPWDPDAVAAWIAREAKKRLIPFNSESGEAWCETQHHPSGMAHHWRIYH